MALDTDDLVPRLRAPVYAFVNDDLPPPDAVQNGDAPNIDGVRTEGGLIDGPALFEALWADPDLSPEQKCAIYLDDTMYPAYPLEGSGRSPLPVLTRGLRDRIRLRIKPRDFLESS